MVIIEKAPSRLETVPDFITAFLNKLQQVSLNENELFNIRLCLEEAIVNAIRHGNKMNPDLHVEVKAELQDSVIQIEVKDQGEGFDFELVPDPTEEENLQKLSGRGIFLIRRIMDEVTYFNGGSSVRMKKKLKRGE